MAAGYEMRVSDAEREAAASELREHFAAGRLDQEELDERLTRAFAAKTHGDLNAIFTDLPSSGHGWAGPAGPAGSQQSAWRADLGRTIGQVAVGTLLMWALLLLGILSLFGIGAGRPFGIVLLLAAFAVLRRLVMMIFGRRRVGGRGGSRRRRC